MLLDIASNLGYQLLCIEKLPIFQMRKASNPKNKGKVNKLLPIMQEHLGISMNLHSHQIYISPKFHRILKTTIPTFSVTNSFRGIPQ